MPLTVQQWIGQLLLKHKKLEQENMQYLQGIFTTLWTIWTHRNLVVHEGKQPNPLEVILTAQSLVCRYTDAFSCCSTSFHRRHAQNKLDHIPTGHWQLIIKVSGARLKNLNRAGYAYEAKTTQGDPILQGISSCTGQTIPVIIQEAMLEAAIKARDLGFKHVLFLSDSRRAVQVNNYQITPSWQEKSFMTDWSHLLSAELNWQRKCQSTAVWLIRTFCNVSSFWNGIKKKRKQLLIFLFKGIFSTN